jgi:2-polyprenyl-6-methoxyphenol hydroxylase-like FAD-dependent oxidoreductase
MYFKNKFNSVPFDYCIFCCHFHSIDQRQSHQSKKNNEKKTAMIVILGGGIVGLYTAWKLQKLGLSFVLLEKETRLGGKIHTITNSSGDLIELGPAVFHSGQKIIMNLMHKLHLPIEPLTKRSMWYQDKLVAPSGWPAVTIKNEEKLVRQVLPRKKQKNIYDFDEVADMTYRDYRRREQITGDMYRCQTGLSSLVHSLTQSIQNRVTRQTKTSIILGVQVTQIDLSQKQIQYISVNHTHAHTHADDNSAYQTLAYDFLICALDRYNASQIKILYQPALKHVYDQWKTSLGLTQDVSTLMLIVEFHPYPHHLRDVDQILSLKRFRWFLRIGRNTAIISYTDGSRAQENHQDFSAHEFLKHCCQELLIDPTHIVKHWYCWWPRAFCVRSTHQYLNPYLGADVYQTFVPHPEHQGYMEAHLIPARKIIKLLQSKPKTIAPDYTP